MMNSETTIASLATAVGQGAIALIRMSGGGSLDILEKCSSAGDLEPRQVKLTNICDRDNSVIDQVLVTWFKAPASYTGEELVEISCHGGMFVTGRILDRLFECGAVPAEPGEFTKRAFLNGRMDLTQAEAVMDIISASSDFALKAAGEQLEGAIGRQVAEMSGQLIEILAHIEAYIDFPDEDISPDTGTELTGKIKTVIESVHRLLATSVQGRILREGVKTVIVGKPNVGKSSLLNLLLGYERAIVSDIEGTTRDTIEEVIHLGGLALRLIDTAGLRESDDIIEQAGMERTGKAISRADLILKVVDASQPYNEGNSVAESAENTPEILILNKCDQGLHSSWEDQEGIRFSCRENYGRDILEQKVLNVFSKQVHINDGASLASINARHQASLKSSLEPLLRACESLEASESPEFTALELREALDWLGEITGKVDTEEILGAIFSTFCIGK